ncbi:MAG: hypothetical protein GY781_15770, partial [Gammaproteobacteria bacterium]|nr:hypothetical protein [Gammaproteobacteria bacterium]
MNVAKKELSGRNEVRTGGGTVTGLLIFFIVVMLANFGYSIFQSSIDTERLNSAEELRVLSQQISNNASESVGGNVDAFDFLVETRISFEKKFLFLQNSLREVDYKFITGEDTSSALKNTNVLWEKVKNNADAILESRNTVLDLHDVASKLSKTIIQLQVQSEQVANELTRIGGTSSQVNFAAKQVWYAERLIGSIQAILAGGDGAREAALTFNQDVTVFGGVVDGLLKGNSRQGIRMVNNSSIRKTLEEISNLFMSVR